jgi:hypothetical protein
MENDPVFLAIWHISDAKRILQELITSSKGFDRTAATKALKDLEAKVKFLAQLETEVRAQQGFPPADVTSVDFHEVPRQA